MARITLSLDRPTGNFWIDTGLVVLLEQFGEGEHESEEVLRKLVDRLVQKTGKSGVYFDQTTGQFRECEKVNWVYPTNLFIKVSGVAPKIKMQINGKTEKFFTQPPVFDLSLKLSKNENPCDICGDVAQLTDAKMWMYPFVVEPGKFGTFYPGTKRGLKLCARCALAGLAGYLGWLWKVQGRNALHFFFFHTEVREMQRLHKEALVLLRLEGEKGRTAPVAFAGPYVNETMLGLLLELFQHVRRSDLLSQDTRQLLASLLGATGAVPPAPITLYVIMGMAWASLPDEGALGILQAPAILPALRRLRGGASGSSRSRESPLAFSAYLRAVLELAGKEPRNNLEKMDGLGRAGVRRRNAVCGAIPFRGPCRGDISRPLWLGIRICSVNT